MKPVYKAHHAAMERMVARHASIIVHSVYERELPRILAAIRHGKRKKADKETGGEEKDLPKIRTRVHHEKVKKADKETGGEEKGIETSRAGEVVSSRADEKIIGELSLLSSAFAPLWRTVLYNMYEGAILEASQFIHETIVQCSPGKGIVQCSPAEQEIIDTYLRKNGSETTSNILDEDVRWMADIIRAGAQAGKNIREIVKDIARRFPEYSESRAEMIARAEIYQASNYASSEMMKAAGLKIK